MDDTVIGEGCVIEKSIIAEQVKMGNNVKTGVGDPIDNETNPNIYNHDLCTIGERSVIPDDVSIGKNVCIGGVTTKKDYPNGELQSGKTLIKAGE
jgi:glucose-1-phosphate adenylyltransferase